MFLKVLLFFPQITNLIEIIREMIQAADYDFWSETINLSQLKKIFFVFCLGFLLSFPSDGRAQLNAPRSETIKTAGDVILYSLPAAAVATTAIKWDKKGAWQYVKGFATNIAITGAMKYGINKERPFNGGGLAFPSGHTSITFQSASYLHLRYGWKYGIPAYALAGFTGWSRINATKHDGWDVLAGAVVGIGSSLIFTTPYEREHMQLTFTSSDDQYLLGFTYKF